MGIDWICQFTIGTPQFCESQVLFSTGCVERNKWKMFSSHTAGELGIGHVTCGGQRVLLRPPLSFSFATLPLVDFKFSACCLLIFNVYKCFVFFWKWSGWGGQPGMATSGVWKSLFCSKWMISFEGVSWIMNNGIK